MAWWWKEIWSTGFGAERTYCGIARTPDGYAVDLFRGYTCLSSDIFASRTAAEIFARTLERRYTRLSRGSQAVA